MIRKKQGVIEWLEFELLQGLGIVHGIFLRHGGVSEGLFASLNVKLGDDDETKVKKNRAQLAKTLNIDHIVSSFAKHGTEIEEVTSPEGTFFCDGLLTNKKKLGLLTTHADCQAAIFYDPIHQVIGSVHAGWRGQVQNIYHHAVKKMGLNFGSRPEELLVCISPSLGPSHAEFKHYKKEIPKEYWHFQVRDTFFDLWAIAQNQLEFSGILPHHIEIAKIDTYANPQDFFSYRRETRAGNTLTGCHGTVVALL